MNNPNEMNRGQKKTRIALDVDRLVESLKFRQLYRLETTIDTSYSKELNKGEKPRWCRYCNNSEPTVKFRNTSHLVPQLLGRAMTISSDECDSCNTMFSKRDDELGKFTLHLRSLFQQKRKSSGPPVFNTPTRAGMRIESPDAIDDPRIVEVVDEVRQENKILTNITSDYDGNEIGINRDSLEFDFPIEPYIPMEVFRTLLKIGFSLISKDELGKFEMIRKLLVADKLNSSSFPIFHLYTWTNPLLINIFPHPIVKVFSQKVPSPDYYEKLLIVEFANFSWQICLPSDQNIDSLSGGKSVKQIRRHPLFGPPFSTLNPPSLNLDHRFLDACRSSFFNDSLIGSVERLFGVRYKSTASPVVPGDIQELRP